MGNRGKIKRAETTTNIVKGKKNSLIQEEISDFNQLRFRESGYSTTTVQRLKIVTSDLLSGVAPVQIVSDYMTEWKVSESSVRRLIRISNKLIQNQFIQEPDKIYNDLLSKYNFLYQQAAVAGNIKLAKELLDSIAKYTQGIKVNITTRVDIIELEPFTESIDFIEIDKDE